MNQEIVNLEDSSRQPKVTALRYNLYVILQSVCNMGRQLAQ